MTRLVKVQDLKFGMEFDALPAVQAGDYTFGENEHDDCVIVAAENLVFEAAGEALVSGNEVFIWAYPFNISTFLNVEVEVY